MNDDDGRGAVYGGCCGLPKHVPWLQKSSPFRPGKVVLTHSGRWLRAVHFRGGAAVAEPQTAENAIMQIAIADRFFMLMKTDLLMPMELLRRA
jgi:hypothetical protein